MRIQLPELHDVDAAPQLAIVAVATVASLAVRTAMLGAHPLLLAIPCDHGGELTRAETLAERILVAAGELYELLHRYRYVVQHEIAEDLERELPF